jgi:antitoxin component YwqK of YwqJK toxin-antitoxin module
MGDSQDVSLFLSGLVHDGRYEIEYHTNTIQLQRQVMYYTNSEEKVVRETKYWYINGQLQEHSFYQGGEKHGPFISYHENGRVKDRFSFEYGLIVGEYRRWRDDGYMHICAKYYNGKIEGLCFWWLTWLKRSGRFNQDTIVSDYDYYINNILVAGITMKSVISLLYFKNRLQKLVKTKLRKRYLDRSLIDDLGNIVMMYYVYSS